MAGYGVVYHVDVCDGESSVELVPTGIGHIRSCSQPRIGNENSSPDLWMHAAYQANVMYRELLIGVLCRKCGTRLKVYYCENRLYAVKCDGCESVTLVKATNPMDAMLTVGEKWWEGKKE